MSFAHYFMKNFTIREVIDLFCYGTRFPHMLTSTQKLTRLYRFSLKYLDAYYVARKSYHFRS
jgi:hypothetical protein